MTETDEKVQGYIDRSKARDWSHPCDELAKLREMLDSEGIEWEDRLSGIKTRNRHFWDTASKEEIALVDQDGQESVRRVFVVTWGEFSYGGTEGLLEVHAFDHGPIGNLTANGACEACRLALERAAEQKSAKR